MRDHSSLGFSRALPMLFCKFTKCIKILEPDEAGPFPAYSLATRTAPIAKTSLRVALCVTLSFHPGRQVNGVISKDISETKGWHGTAAPREQPTLWIRWLRQSSLRFRSEHRPFWCDGFGELDVRGRQRLGGGLCEIRQEGYAD